MIEVQQGTPGSGKSAVAVARAISHLYDGGVVAANFSLTDGWADVLARRSIFARRDDNVRYKKASSLHGRFFRVDSVSAIRSIDPKALAVGKQKTDGTYKEGQGLLILDEAQLCFNARKWEKNFPWIEFFTQHRKLGWNVILIAHTIDMIDGQIRPLAEYESRFRNMQKVKFPVLGFPLAPFPFFVVIRRYAGLGVGASMVSDRKAFPLPLYAAKLYDSCLVFSADQWGEETEAQLCGPAPSPPYVKKVPAPRRRSRLVGPHWDEYLMTHPSSD